MRKLTKTQQAEHERLGEALDAAANAFREALAEAIEFSDIVLEAMTEYEGERSDKWQESEAAAEWQAWRDQWQEAHSDLEQIDTDPIEMWVNLPSAVGE